MVVTLLMVAQFGFGLGYTIFNVLHVSLRQSLTPDAMQGRMHATMILVLQGIAPLGAVTGGAFGEWIGLQPTLIIASLGELTALLWLWLSPLATKALPIAESS
jgi:predicted MFS family arabinose efflux permease